MSDLFKDSPAYEWVAEEVREKVQAEADQRALHVLRAFQQTVVDLVAERFPKLERLAKKQVSAVEKPERLQSLILRVSITQDPGEMAKLLADLDEDEKGAQ